MSITEPQPTVPPPKRRWYHMTPDRVVIAFLAVEVLLWLFDRFHWFGFNKDKDWTVLIAVATIVVAVIPVLSWLFARMLFRRPFRFSIRSFVLLAVAVAIPCGPLAAEVWQAKKQREARAKSWEKFKPIKELGGSVYDGCGWVRGGVYVQFNDRRVSDATLERLKGLIPIDGLGLTYCKITDAGLEHLKGMSQLSVLRLEYTQITDVGLEHLKDLTRLEWLALDGTQVTDNGLEHLTGLTRLAQLTLDGTQVTAAGAKKLQQILPGCEIDWSPPTPDEQESSAKPDPFR